MEDKVLRMTSHESIDALDHVLRRQVRLGGIGIGIGLDETTNVYRCLQRVHLAVPKHILNEKITIMQDLVNHVRTLGNCLLQEWVHICRTERKCAIHCLHRH